MHRRFNVIHDLANELRFNTKLVAKGETEIKPVVEQYVEVLNALYEPKTPVLRIPAWIITEHFKESSDIKVDELIPPYARFFMEFDTSDVEGHNASVLVYVDTCRIPNTNSFLWKIMWMPRDADNRTYVICPTIVKNIIMDKGTPMIHTGTILSSDLSSRLHWTHDKFESTKKSVVKLASNVVMACILLSAKNIKRVEEQEVILMPAGKKGNKRKPVINKFITIAVEVTPKQQSKLGLSRQYITFDEMRKRNIIQRRGCLRDYTKGKGLFGKLHGIWYWNPIIMGTVAKDSVVKDK